MMQNFGKCPKCGQQHSQFEVTNHMSPGITHGEDAVIESFICCQCGVTVQRKHLIVVSTIELEVYYDGKEHITVDNRTDDYQLRIRSIGE